MDDRERFILLLREHGDKAYNFAYQLAGNDVDARELVQEASVRAFENMLRYDPSRPFDAWLLSILRNIFLDWQRRAERRHTLPLDAVVPGGTEAFDEVLQGPDADPAADALRAESAEQVQKALSALPEHYRSAVVLSDMEGMSYQDIAHVLDVPVGTVRSRIHTGRALLRRALSAATGGTYGTA